MPHRRTREANGQVPFVALHYFHGVFVNGVVKLSFSDITFSSMASLCLYKHYTHSRKGHKGFGAKTKKNNFEVEA